VFGELKRGGENIHRHRPSQEKLWFSCGQYLTIYKILLAEFKKMPLEVGLSLNFLQNSSKIFLHKLPHLPNKRSRLLAIAGQWLAP
jgi:hypothetical protein